MEPAKVGQALAATAAVASELGLVVDDTVVINISNRLTVRLVPCDVLARVAVSNRRNHDVATFELEMAQRLEGPESMIGALAPQVEPLVYVRDGVAVTFWQYYEPLPASDIRPAEYARALKRLHTDMRRLDVATPHFTDRVDKAQAIVRDRSQSPGLADGDRELLSHSLRSLRRAVVDRKSEEQLLHGEPHAGNLLKTTSGLRFVDLETCCRGPVEFDIVHAPEEVVDRYTLADQLQLRDCRILMLAMVAAWRADRDDEFPNGREMRDELLRKIREALDDNGVDVPH